MLKDHIKALELALEELDVQWEEHKRLKEELNAEIQKGKVL